jgi:hypothetical protein
MDAFDDAAIDLLLAAGDGVKTLLERRSEQQEAPRLRRCLRRMREEIAKRKHAKVDG